MHVAATHLYLQGDGFMFKQAFRAVRDQYKSMVMETRASSPWRPACGCL